MATEAHTGCIARGRAYDLLATGLTDGLRPDRVAHFRAVPALAPHIGTDPDPDGWASAHHTALSLEVPPYEGAFLSETGQLDDGEGLRQAYARGGLSGVPEDQPPDHVGVELRFLAWLSGAEADAILDGQEDARAQVQDLASSFIDAHLGRWLPALAVALQTSPPTHPFFRELALLAAELVSSHRAQLPGPVAAWSLPPVPDLLSDPDTRLADLATTLTIPSLAGGMLSRAALAGIGRSAEVPKGFGSRALMLTNLMRSAAEYERLPEVLAGLGVVATGWSEAHAALGATVWADRAQDTVGLLNRMAEQAGLRE